MERMMIKQTEIDLPLLLPDHEGERNACIAGPGQSVPIRAGDHPERLFEHRYLHAQPDQSSSQILGV